MMTVHNASDGHEVASIFVGLYLNRHYRCFTNLFVRLTQESRNFEYNFTIPCLKALRKSGDNHYIFTTRNEVCLSCIKGIDRGVSLTEALVTILRQRKEYIPDDISIPIIAHSPYAVTAVFPILSAGDLHGGIVIVSDDYAKPTETQLVKARFLRDIIAQEVEGL